MSMPLMADAGYIDNIGHDIKNIQYFPKDRDIFQPW